jgi:hypothetical protein
MIRRSVRVGVQRGLCRGRLGRPAALDDTAAQQQQAAQL